MQHIFFKSYQYLLFLVDCSCALKELERKEVESWVLMLKWALAALSIINLNMSAMLV